MGLPKINFICMAHLGSSYGVCGGEGCSSNCVYRNWDGEQQMIFCLISKPNCLATCQILEIWDGDAGSDLTCFYVGVSVTAMP